MTDAGALCPLIVFHAGSVAGHNEDYINDLLVALAPFRPQKRLVAAGQTRWGLILREVQSLLRVPRASVVIIQTVMLRDAVSLLPMAYIRRDARAVMVLRREPEAMTGGRRWKAWLFRAVVQLAARSRRVTMVSDSTTVLDGWGLTSMFPQLPIPSHGGSDDTEEREDVIALLGSMRIEKGADLYPTVIACARDVLPGSRVLVQLSPGTEPEQRIADEIRGRWGADDRVILVEGQIPQSEYLSLHRRSRIVVLTHDQAMYGSGTSGVLADALAAGSVVVSPPLSWAVSEFGDHPRLVWLHERSEAGLAHALREAVMRSPGDPDSSALTRFAETWRQIIVTISGDGPAHASD